jgi:hypothetical protein
MEYRSLGLNNKVGDPDHQETFQKPMSSISTFLPGYHTVLKSLFASRVPSTSHVIDHGFGFDQGCVGTRELAHLRLKPCNEISSERTECTKRLSSDQLDDTRAAPAPITLSPPEIPTESEARPRTLCSSKLWSLAEWPADDAESPIERRRKQVREAVRRNREKKRRHINGQPEPQPSS